MLVGISPPEPARSTSTNPSSWTAKIETSLLPAFATRSQRPSELRRRELWEGRWGCPVPRPPVPKRPSGARRPPDARRYAITSFPAASFVCT